MQRGENEELPWVQRDSSAAYQLLVAARQGHAPQRPVERLALLQLLIQLHRQSHERTGDPHCQAFLCLRPCRATCDTCSGSSGKGFAMLRFQ